jgi:hypothetical protein
MKQSCVDPFDRLLEEGEVLGSPQTKSLQERGIEGEMCDKVTVSQSSVELEPEKDEEGGQGELDPSATTCSGIRDSIAKTHKLVKEEVKAASFGRVE